MIISDLHNHSYYSDGVLSPKDLIHLGYKAGCDLFALTDHDTTDGIVEAENQADKLGLRFVCGVEISAIWNNMTIHILGLNIDINNKILQDGLKKHQEFRHIRAKKIARGLAAAGVKNALEKVKKIAKTDMLTRTHFAQMLIQDGVCKDIKSVFKRYLIGKKPGGIKGKWEEFDKVIKWIHAAGGVAILAHPFRYRMTNTKIKRLMSEFKNYSGDGVEVVTGTSSIEEITLSSKWADELNLLHSSGSDYHGWDNGRVKVGNLVKLPNPDKSVWNILAK